MLDKIFKTDEKKLFLINNFFQLIYFSFIIKEYKLENYTFIIFNYKGYINNHDYLLNGLKYTIYNDILIRKFPYSMIDIFILKKGIQHLTNKYSTLIATTNNNLLNKIFLGVFKKHKVALINTTPDSLISEHISIYDCVYNLLTGNKNIFTDKLSFNDLQWDRFFKKYKGEYNIKKIVEKNNLNINSNNHVIIFLGQNHKELGISDEKYNTILVGLKKGYTQQGVQFYIKPHPLDQFNYTDFNIIQKQFPGELLNLILDKNKTTLLTFYSTTILTLLAKHKIIIQYGKKFNEIQLNLINRLKYENKST